jgi:spermidine/putrescine transport system permease protein
MTLPIVIPEVCMGVALLMFFASSGMRDFFVNAIWPFNLSTIIFAHIAFCFPFVAIVVRSRLVGFNRQLEEASRDLGASEAQTFFQILVPFMMPGIVAGALLAFTLSLDDFVITFFTGGPGSITFPVQIYSMVKTGVKYEVNAASTILIFITIVATVIAMKLQAPEKSGH